MPIKLPLKISLTVFKNRLREKPKKGTNDSFSGDDLKELGKDFWGTGKHLDSKFITPAWKFPTKDGQYHSADEIYKRCIKIDRIIAPVGSPFAK